MKNIQPEDFKVTDKISLADIPTSLDLDDTKNEKEQLLEEIGLKLSELQDTMYAHNRYGVLVCLQGMDTAGKDSLIREVFRFFNPRGVVVHSFKTPHSKELQYDYLWRHYKELPEKGKFSVFNRSHYENVLVTRVNPQYLMNENIPGIEKPKDIPADFWKKRIKQIKNFEKHITENGVIVFKFFLHLSKEEQRQRLLRRLEIDKHNWKFNPSDISERKLWDDYQKYYEEAINKTSKKHAPWYIIPADDRQTARYIVAKTIYEEMLKYTDIKEPKLAPKIKENISWYIEKLNKKEV
jgi:PPK2 family polyphosphate:nucleotide phosphotransferase